MLWHNALMIGFACVACGYMGTLGFRAALVVSPFIIVLAGLGGFYSVMDATGWAMLIGPTAFAFLGATLATLWRRRRPPEPDFVAPPPPPGWRQKRRARLRQKPDDSFTL